MIASLGRRKSQDLASGRNSKRRNQLSREGEEQVAARSFQIMTMSTS